MNMQTHWKKYLWRHGLFTYARDSLIFFVNLYLWSQVSDLKIIALFNILYLVSHTSMFILGLPAVKAGRSQSLMRGGLAGLAVILAAIMGLDERVVDHIYPLAILIGLSNGAYWLVNHVEGIDRSDNKSRASFLSYRRAAQGAAKLAVPGVGWIVFTLFSNDTVSYTVIFGIAMCLMVVSWWLTDIPRHEEDALDVKKSLKEFSETKYFKITMLNGILFGLSLRSALAAILLPFLIFQVVEKESSLNIIQTAFEIVAIAATYYFAGHKKNTDYINRLFFLGAGATLLGLFSLFIELSIHTYIIYVITYVISLSATSIASGTMSNNYVTLVKDYKKHRIEYVVIREVFAISGFTLGYVFIYFNDDLSLSSLRPLIAVMALATVVSLGISLKIWRHVQQNH